MKITVKTLKHDQFQLDVDSEDTILSVKQKIKETKDHDVPLQKLIYSGSILVDDKKLSDYNITEKDFMVLVVSKPSPKTSAGSSSTGNKTATPDTVKGSTTSTTVKETSTQKTDAIQSSATTTTPTTTDANTTTTTTTTTTATETTTASNTPTTGLFDNPNALVTGADYERAVQNMVEMGFDRELVVSAMRASFNNPNRAVEYLMSGIPELDNNPPTTTPSATTQPNVDTTATTTATTTAAATNPMPGLTNPASTTGAPNLSSQPLNLFQQAQNLQRQRATQGGGGGGGGQGGGNIDDLNFLRNQPHFRSLRQFIQQNPGSLQPLLQQIGSTNPELLQLINSNPGMFMRLLQEPDEGEPQVVSVTQEEKEAIDRLEALGFDRALAIEAYLACDKNEEMAANFLFDHMNDDEN